MNSAWKIVVVVAVITIMVICIDLFLKTEKLKQQNKLLTDDNYRLHKFILEKYGDTPSVVNLEVDALIKEFKQHSITETVQNLERAKELYNDGHREEAVRKLVVIIENKLKEKLETEKDSWFASLTEKTKKFLNLSKLLFRAKEISMFDDFEYSLAVAATKIRHGESHNEGFSEETMRSEISFCGCIEIIKKLKPSHNLVQATIV